MKARAADGAMVTFDATELSSLVYLHAMFCECLRLYPPIPFEHKAAAAADLLPSGKQLKAGDKVIMFAHSMGIFFYFEHIFKLFLKLTQFNFFFQI